MNSDMTITTQRNDFKRSGIVIMMIMFSFFATYITYLCIRRWYMSIMNSIANLIMSYYFLWMICSIFFSVSVNFYTPLFSIIIFYCSCFGNFYTLFCFSVFLYIFLHIQLTCFGVFPFCLCFFAYFCFMICHCVCIITSFARAKTTIISRFIFIKLRNWFFLLAFRALFCLNCLSHNLISIIKLWLGPVSGYNPFLARLILSSQTNLSTSFWRNFQWQ